MVRWGGLFLVLLLEGGIGCSSPKPYVSVLGVSHLQRQQVVMMLEVHNPTGTALRLSQLDYRLRGPGGREAARGRVMLDKTIGPGHSSVIDVPVPVLAASDDRLEGQLRAFAGEVEVSFRVATRTVRTR